MRTGRCDPAQSSLLIPIRGKNAPDAGFRHDRKRVRMGARFGRKLIRVGGLLLAVGVLSAVCGEAQGPTGAVAGTLTDTRSAPLENVSVTLRNVATGSAVSAVTSRGGRYGFKGLAVGEYTLAASGPRGSGAVGGIVVSPGHVSRVQTVIEFARPRDAGVGLRSGSDGDRLAGVDGGIRAREILARISSDPKVRMESGVVEASLQVMPLAVMPVAGLRRSVSLPRPGPGVPLISVVSVLKSSGVAEFEPAPLALLQNALLAVRMPARPQIVAALAREAQDEGERLDAAEIESLPKSRDWSSFLIDARRSVDDDDRERGRSGGLASQSAVDHMHVGSAFGVAEPGSGEAFSTGESAVSAIRRVRRATPGDLITQIGPRMGRESVGVETRRGGAGLHGQIFLFDREKLLGAQNPFAQWVKETAPPSGARVPTFTAQPYTPSDLELRWGAGVGGVLRGRHLFWFSALDGYRRNNPAIASVRHPERFFAQPANDQMQLLSAQLGLSSVDPVTEGVNAYSKLLESLAGLLGPAPRSLLQASGFGRVDGRAGERHQFTLEGNRTSRGADGGGSALAWQNYGAHSLGKAEMSSAWVLGRWSAFVSPNLLTVTQGSFGRNVQRVEPGRPSAFEQSLNMNAWGQLPQIVVDSRDGFTIGNPARFARGTYPDESALSVQQQVKWVHGNVMLDVGGAFSHEVDATRRLQNQTGTYHYASIGDFASDALTFFAYGISGQLNPMDQHNCDQRGRPWRDAGGVLHGLGYLPCYSYYTQTMGPSEWWLSTNDWAGYATSQWQISKTLVFTLGGRWELQELPPRIATLGNPDLPLTGRLPGLGNQWGPRAGAAWGSAESHWPVLRVGYGMYFSRTPNAQLEAALTQTGSMSGDLNYFFHPTDNLRAGGAPPFPYVLAGEPGTVVKPGAVEYALSFRNGEVHQAEVSVEELLPGRVRVEASGVASLGRRLPVTMDANVDSAANPKTITYEVVDGDGAGPIKGREVTVPFFASWPSAGAASGFAGRLNANYQEVSEIFSRANSTYEAMIVRLSRNGRGLTFRARYMLGHAADWNPDDSPMVGGPSVLDPVDFRQEYGTSDLDVRHSLTTTVIVQPKWKLRGELGALANGWMMSGVGQLHSGLPYTMRTAGSLAKEFNVSGQPIVGLSTGMNGYGGDNRVYGVGRNTFRYPGTWKADLRIAKRFDLGQMRQLELMAESFNLFNHQNVTQVETTGYSIEQGTMNGAMPRLSFLTGLKNGQTEFGKPLNINATDLYRERQVQFGARVRF